MNNFFIIHGITGPNTWMEWLENSLLSLGDVFVPEFPCGKKAIRKDWESKMSEVKDKINAATIFICHSIGCLFAINYLAKHNIKIKAIIFVAGPADASLIPLPDGKKSILPRVLEDFLPKANTTQKFLKLVGQTFAVYSNEDHIFPIENLQKFAKNLKAKEIRIYDRSKGHFGSRDNVESISEIYEIIKTF